MVFKPLKTANSYIRLESQIIVNKILILLCIDTLFYVYLTQE